MRLAAVRRIAVVLIALCGNARCCCALPEDHSPLAKPSASPKASDWNVEKLIEMVRAAENSFANLETVVRTRRTLSSGAVPIKNARRKTITLTGIHEDVVTRTAVQVSGMI